MTAPASVTASSKLQELCIIQTYNGSETVVVMYGCGERRCTSLASERPQASAKRRRRPRRHQPCRETAPRRRPHWRTTSTTTTPSSAMPKNRAGAGWRTGSTPSFAMSMSRAVASRNRPKTVCARLTWMPRRPHPAPGHRRRRGSVQRRVGRTRGRVRRGCRQGRRRGEGLAGVRPPPTDRPPQQFSVRNTRIIHLISLLLIIKSIGPLHTGPIHNSPYLALRLRPSWRWT